MARVTVQDCLSRINNHFALVILAAQRARTLAAGERPLVVCQNRSAVTALREIAAGHVDFRENVDDTVRAFLAEARLVESDKRKKKRQDRLLLPKTS